MSETRQVGRSEEPMPLRLGQILLLEEEIRREQIAVEPLGVPATRATPATPVPAEKVAQLARYEEGVRGVVGEEAYRRLGPSPACPGLLWRGYVDRLHVLKATLRERKQQMLSQRLGR